MRQRTIPPSSVIPHLQRVIAPFLMMKNDVAGLASGVLAGRTMSDISKEQGITLQLLHQHWKSAKAALPILEHVKSGMMGKGVGRKPGSGSGLSRKTEAEKAETKRNQEARRNLKKREQRAAARAERAEKEGAKA